MGNLAGKGWGCAGGCWKGDKSNRGDIYTILFLMFWILRVEPRLHATGAPQTTSCIYSRLISKQGRQ